MGTQKTHEQFLEELAAKKINIEVLEPYVTSQTPINCKCKKCGKIWKVRPNNLLHGYGCPSCGLIKRANSQTKSSNQFYNEIHGINPNVKILEEYKGARIPISCECSICGHQWEASPTNLLKGKGCPICARKMCADKKRLTHQYFLQIIESFHNDITPLEKYRGNSIPIKMRCNVCEYEWKTSPASIMRGHGCPRCAGNGSYSSKEFREKLYLINPFVEILNEYKSSITPVTCKCQRCNHVWEARPNNLLQGKGCPACYHSSTSFIEQVIYEVLSLIIGKDHIITRDRKAIGKELDIYVPSLKFAIEPGSWRWHCDKFDNDNKKRILCEQKDIRLITIYSDYENDTAPFDYDCICVKETLGFENDIAVLKLVVSTLLQLLDFEYNISSSQWNEIVKSAYLNSRRITTKEYADRVCRLHPTIEIIGEYTGAWNKINCRCQICGHEWKPAANSLLQGHGCPKCAASQRGENKRKGHQQFVDEVRKVNPEVDILGTYVRLKDKITCKCLVCGNTWDAMPSNLLKGKGCSKCAASQKGESKRKGHQQFVDEVAKINPEVDILGTYVRSKDKIKCRCLICGNTWDAIPSNLLKGRGCPLCAVQKRRTTRQNSLKKREEILAEKNPVMLE